MQIGDGHRIVEIAGGKIVAQPVSRWEEIQDTVIYHSQMAAVMNSPTVFRLLNHPGPTAGRQEFSVAKDGRDVENDIRQARLVMTRAKPDGVTPLTEHIWEVASQIRQMLPHLQRTGQRVSTYQYSQYPNPFNTSLLLSVRNTPENAWSHIHYDCFFSWISGRSNLGNGRASNR
jgi:hypothetical protein